MGIGGKGAQFAILLIASLLPGGFAMLLLPPKPQHRPPCPSCPACFLISSNILFFTLSPGVPSISPCLLGPGSYGLCEGVHPISRDTLLCLFLETPALPVDAEVLDNILTGPRVLFSELETDHKWHIPCYPNTQSWCTVSKCCVLFWGLSFPIYTVNK